jgi:hypothetical protein
MEKFKNKNHFDILSNYWTEGHFQESNSLSGIAHFVSNFEYLKQWCADDDNHPEHNSSNCALIYALVPFKAKKKD